MGSFDKATIEYEEGDGELVVISRYKLDGDSPIYSRMLDIKKIVAAVSILLFQPSEDVEGSLPSTGHLKSTPNQGKDTIYPVPLKKRMPAVVPATISTVPVQGFWLPHLAVPSKNINTDSDNQDDVILITDHDQIHSPEKMWHHNSQEKAKTSLDQIGNKRLPDYVENKTKQSMHDNLEGGQVQWKNTTVPELSHLSNLSVLSSTTAVIDLSEENAENTNSHFELNIEHSGNKSTTPAVDVSRAKPLTGDGSRGTTQACNDSIAASLAGDGSEGTTLAGDGGRTTNLAGCENKSCHKPGPTSDHHQCLFCGKLLQSEKSIIEHSKDHLNIAPKNEVVCPVCNTNFPWKRSASFKSHVASHFEYEPNVVQPSEFSVSHSARNPFEVFTADSEGMYTLNLTKYSDKNQEKKLVCQFCNSILKTHYDVVDHSVLHGQMQCAICRKSFSQKQCLSRHAAQHAQNIVYMCHICGTVFNRKDNLKRHIKCHDKGRFKSSSGKTWFARQCLRRACSTVQGRTNRDKIQAGNLNSCISMEQEIENEVNIAKDSWDKGAKDDASVEDRPTANDHSIIAEVPQDIEKQPEYGPIEVKIEKMDADEHDTCTNNNMGLTKMNATPYDSPYENTHCTNLTEASIFINSSLENTFTDVEHFSCIRCFRLFNSFDELKEHESVHHLDGLQFCTFPTSIKSQQKDVSEQGSLARSKVDQHCKSPSGFRGIEKSANVNVAVFSGEYGIRPGQSWQPPLPAHSPVAQGTSVYGIRASQESATVTQETLVSRIKTGQELDSSINTLIKKEVIHVDETSSSSSHSEYQNFGDWVEFHSALRTSVQPTSDNDPSVHDPDAVPCRVVTGLNDQFRMEGARQSNIFHATTFPSGPSLPLDNSNLRQKSQEASFPVKCLLCNVMLNNPREIGDHSDQHGHVYACPFCKGQLSTKTTLLRHLNTHLDYTIPCQLCTAKFNRRDNLLRHLKTRHNIDKNNFDMNTLRYFT